MDKEEKLHLLKKIIDFDGTYKDDFVQDTLNQMGDLKRNYSDYLTTEPINVETELKRVDGADYETLSALLTMLLREDHFCNGVFEERWQKGEPQKIVKCMIEKLK